MASGYLCKLHGLLSRLSNGSILRHAKTCLVPTRLKSATAEPPHVGGVANSQVDVAVTEDGMTIVCFHPAADVPYELTQPVTRPNPLTNPAETHDQVLKAHLGKDALKVKEGASVEELSKMFFTTKHRWYPVGQERMRRRMKNDHPKDR